MRRFKFKKIFHRLFAYIFAVIMVILTLVFGFQLLFLEDWYLSGKTDGMMTDIDTLTKELEDSDLTYEKFYQITEEFMALNDVTVYIDEIYFYEDFAEDSLLYEEVSQIANIRLRDEEGGYFYTFLEVYDEGQMKLLEAFSPGESVHIVGISEGDTLIPFEVNGVFLEVYYEDVYDDYELDSDYEGEMISDSQLFDQETLIDASFTVVDRETTVFEKFVFESILPNLEEAEIIEEVRVNADLSYYIYLEPFTGVKKMVFEKELDLEGVEHSSFFVESSLVGVSETIELMKPFYVLFFIVAGMLAVISALMVSSRFSKPIIMMREKAEAMSEMEFGTAIEVDGNDELSSLADSINTMSEKLEHTIHNLEKSNRDLYDEIEKERANEGRRREFIANVSHDLKTPIGIAKGYLEALKVQLREDKRDEYLEITMKEMDKMNRIVVDMLQLLRMESDEGNLKLSLLPFEPYVEESVAYFEVMAGKKGMTFQIEGAFGPCMFEDKTMRSLLTNLLSNAVRYGVGDTEIRILSRKSDDGYIVYISNVVENPAAMVTDEIWHKFYTGDVSRNREQSGTGLGMSLVKSILDSYGSTYEAKVAGERFVFRFTLKGE